MDAHARRKRLESRLQAVLGELNELCGELGIELSLGDSKAAAPPVVASRDLSGPVLLVRLDQERVGFAARDVRELVRVVALAPPVEPRPELSGYVNVRGQALPVINLRYMLGLPDGPLDPDHVLIILGSNDLARLGIVVDEVLDIYDLEDDAYQDRSALDLHKGFIDGVARVQGELVAVVHPGLLAQLAL